jgi:hypothetical protein
VSWTYEIITGIMREPSGSILGIAYAGGKCGEVPAAVNNPAYCFMKDVGPLPPGHYLMVALVDDPNLGPNAIQLEPVPDGNGSLAWMDGRGDFFIHADLIDAEEHPRSASDGCIAGLAAWQRLEMWGSPDHDLLAVPMFGPEPATEILPF